MKPLKLKGYRARQLQAALQRHLGLPLNASSRVVLHSRGPQIQIWIVAPKTAAATPLVMPDLEVAATTTTAPTHYSWATFNESALSDRLRAEALHALSRIAIRFVIGAGDATAAAHPSSTLGLDVAEFNSLRAVLGEGTLGQKKSQPLVANDSAALLDWLWSYRRNDSPWTRAIAGAVACASMGQQPLWLALGLTGRDPLNTLLAGHFPALYRLNHTHMGWKKFFSLKVAASVPQPPPAPAAQHFMQRWPESRCR